MLPWLVHLRQAALRRPVCTAVTVCAICTTASTAARLVTTDLTISHAPLIAAETVATKPVLHLHDDSPRPTSAILHNPFSKPTEVAPPLPVPEEVRSVPELTLTAVAIAASPTAIINGRLVRIGDTIDSFEIRQIDRTGVTLRGDDEEFRLERSKR